MKRTYENALKLLESRRRTARPKTPAALNAGVATPAPSSQTLRGIPSLAGMKEWLEALGHSTNDINDLNIIHVAGTKGKGSTCAFTRSFLHAHGLRTGFPKRVGLYTGPDLQSIRERIQIDNQPITEDLFTRYFFEVWDRLLPSDRSDTNNEGLRQPRYLQLLALLAFHTFIRERVQAAIFETHHGGEYDATNVISQPVVTAITSLGMDHVMQLGPTIEDIAWHKSGIFKPGVPAFSAPQDPGPVEVMRRRAEEKNAPLKFVSINENLLENKKVLAVPVQRINCSLALEIAQCFLRAKAPKYVMDDDLVREGVQNFSWPGRFEIIQDGAIRWFLDGAHNPLSLIQASKWFADNTASGTKKCRILIFSHYSEERDGVTLVEELARALLENDARPDKVIFTTYNERKDGTRRIDKTLRIPETPFPDLRTVYATLWEQKDPRAMIYKEPTIEDTLALARRVAAENEGAQILVTGSLHLVGGALSTLRPYKLAGKNVLLIGGTSGIGFSVAEKVLREGAHITISSSSEERIANAVGRLQKSSPEYASNVRSYAADLSIKEKIEKNVVGLLQYAAKDSTIDHVVFTAGNVPPMAPLPESTFEHIDAFLNVRFYGALAIGKYARKYITPSKTSSITLTSGSQASKPSAWLPPIVCMAVEGVVKGLAVDLAPVRVNAAAPGFVQTELLEKMPKEMAEVGLKMSKNKSLTKDIGYPDDTSEAYLYFMKDTFVTGIVLKTNGGIHLT
ncbi:tetrahydrofolylpolyglutamate synthase, putative [Talaromyces stipitatus ATCC 10500]|uniref:tetrahydrofolate synthase n=1 Tax=Talaromyces stipitatus (strain ATCC 10500 / CBS 375.48 / QM 6759 / NRRL 1006) TaxID=441959 RepID=B8M7U6_TALSN|nr:tetrahydrofolylpolyglutamate synthase, putative [Talaromyces stipitatus ATCC 10500]EED19825.1 tetrahydrofolylpolyglutamate synthase, putative [Talaromyces stipitatus ATCC 10500]